MRDKILSEHGVREFFWEEWKWCMVDLQEVGWDFEEGMSFLGLGDMGSLQICMGVCIAVCRWEKIVWEMSIELSRMCENGHDLNVCKYDDFLGDV
jgi:hypothetical protein